MLRKCESFTDIIILLSFAIVSCEDFNYNFNHRTYVLDYLMIDTLLNIDDKQALIQASPLYLR